MFSLAKSLAGTSLSRIAGGMGMLIFDGRELTIQD
jgi:hypothetical protein